jgi:nucleotide-binding universal stress UspA family protein
MTDSGAALATRGLGDADRLMLVVDAATEPAVLDWAARWCRRAARELDVRAVPSVPDLQVPGELAEPAVLVPPAAREPAGPLSVVAALRELPDDASVLASAAEAAAELAGALTLVHAVPWSFAERSVGMDAALDRGHRLLGSGLTLVRREYPDLPDVGGRLTRARPHELVGGDLAANLLVLGGPRRGSRNELGLVTRSALHHAPCPVLVVPRPAR